MIVIIQKQVNAVSVNKQAVVKVRIANFNIPSGLLTSSFTQKGSLLVGLGDGIFLELPPGTDGEYLQYDSSALAGIKTSVPSIDVADSSNHLMNGGFNFAQRQAPGTLTTISNDKYGPDRWRMTRENADLQYIRVDGSGENALTSPYYGQFKKITNAGKILIFQPLEYLDTLKFRGKTVNFQLQMKASAAKTIKIAIVELATGGTADTLPAATVTAWAADGTDPTLGANYATIGTPTTCSVTTSWQTFQFTGAFPSNSKNLLVMVWANADFAANDTLSLAEAGLYFGSSLRSWVPRTTTDELLLCRRYCLKTFPFDTAPAQNAGAIGSFRCTATRTAANVNWLPFRLPVSMRSIPSVTLYNPSAASAQAYNTSLGVSCTLTTVNPADPQSIDTINIRATGSAGTTIGDSLDVHLLAEAEL